MTFTKLWSSQREAREAARLRCKTCDQSYSLEISPNARSRGYCSRRCERALFQFGTDWTELDRHVRGVLLDDSQFVVCKTSKRTIEKLLENAVALIGPSYDNMCDACDAKLEEKTIYTVRGIARSLDRSLDKDSIRIVPIDESCFCAGKFTCTTCLSLKEKGQPRLSPVCPGCMLLEGDCNCCEGCNLPPLNCECT